MEETTPETTTASKITELLQINGDLASLERRRAALLEQINTDDPAVAGLAASLGLRRKSGRKPGHATKKACRATKAVPAKKRSQSQPVESSGVPPCYTDGSKYTGD